MYGIQDRERGFRGWNSARGPPMLGAWKAGSRKVKGPRGRALGAGLYGAER